MTRTNERSSPMAELARLLDAWGGMPERWPTEARERIEAIARAEPEAQRLLAEARALDSLLDLGRHTVAQLPLAERSALASRIVAAAIAGERVATHRDEPSREAGEVVPLQPRRRSRAVPVMRGEWRAAALMAASLLLGVYLGGAINMAPVLQDIADAVGISAEFEPTIVAASEDASDEDTL